jgi:glycine/D-amino acid oxidase-like deaminating enzyme
MPLLHPTHILILGAGAAGLMTARELLRAGKRVTILDARDQCGVGGEHTHGGSAFAMSDLAA